MGKVRKHWRVSERMVRDVASLSARLGVPESRVVELAYWLGRDALVKELRSGGQSSVAEQSVPDVGQLILFDPRFQHYWEPA